MSTNQQQQQFTNTENTTGNNDKQSSVLQLTDIKSVTEALDRLQEGIDKGVQKGAYNLSETNMYIKSIAYLSKVIDHLDSLQRNTLIKTVEQASQQQQKVSNK